MMNDPTPRSLYKKDNPCLIVRNSEFLPETRLDSLDGYEKDEVALTVAFGKLGFKVQPSPNITCDDMWSLFQECREKNYEDADCLVVCILSHGTVQSRHGNMHGMIYGIDGKKISINDIIERIDQNNTLKGKPKLFFIQACRGKETPYPNQCKGITASAPTLQCSMPPDTFVYYSTTNSFISLVRCSGSIFVTNLCKILNTGERNLDKLVTKVNRMVSEDSGMYKGEEVVQQSELMHNLRYELILGTQLSEKTVENPLKYTVMAKNQCYILMNRTCRYHACGRFKEYKESIEKTFKQEHFEIVTTKLNLKAAEINKHFNDLGKADFENVGCFIYFILACGGEDNEQNVIYGTDGVFYSTDTMIGKMNSNKTLVNKPKLFFMLLNKCNKSKFKGAESTNPGSSESCGSAGGGRSTEADTFVFYSMIENESDEHCEFIPNLCEVFSAYQQRNLPLHSIVTKVNEKCYGQKGNPIACHTLTSELYFHSGGGQVEAASTLSEPYSMQGINTEETKKKRKEGENKRKVEDAMEQLKPLGFNLPEDFAIVLGVLEKLEEKPLTYDYVEKLIKINDVSRVKIILSLKGNELAAMRSVMHKYSLVHSAVIYSNSEILNVLVDGGCQLNVSDVSGQTPMFEAARFGKIEILQSLMQRKADLLQKNNEGFNCIDKAKLNNEGEAVDLLIEHLHNKRLKDNGKLAGATTDFVYSHYDLWGNYIVE